MFKSCIFIPSLKSPCHILHFLCFFASFFRFSQLSFLFWERGNISNFKYCYLQHALQIPDEGVCLQQLFYPVVSSYHSVIGHGWIEEEVTFSLSKDVKLPMNGGQLRNPCRGYVTNKRHSFAGELIPTTDEVLLFVKSGFRHLQLLKNCPRKTFSYVANFLFPIAAATIRVNRERKTSLLKNRSSVVFSNGVLYSLVFSKPEQRIVLAPPCGLWGGDGWHFRLMQPCHSVPPIMRKK